MYVCDVGHGDSVFIKFPSGKTTLIDCGGNPDVVAASGYLKALGVNELNYLSISHPHVDHIRDIIAVDKNYHPAVLGRNKIFTKEKIKEENAEVFVTHKEIIEKYLEMNNDYNEPVSGDPDKDPTMNEWGNGACCVSYSNDDPDMSLNDLSRVLFIEYRSHTILHAGDLEKKGWLKHLENPYFVKSLKKTSVFIASHHGRENGFCADIFKLFTPKIILVSDGRFGDTSATSRYDDVTEGMNVKLNSKMDFRKVLTTRNDGLMVVYIENGTDLSIFAQKST